MTGSFLNALKIYLFFLMLSFLYCSKDPSSMSDSNNPPEAYNRYVTVETDKPRIIELDASDPDRNALFFRIIKLPGHGSMQKLGTDIWRYTPESGYDGDDSFTFKANDGFADSNEALITIKVGINNHPPTAYSDSIEVAIDSPSKITLNVSDPDEGDKETLEYEIVTAPQYGELTHEETDSPNVWTYTPATITPVYDRFYFRARDLHLAESNIASVRLTVGFTIHVPVINGSLTEYNVDEDSDGSVIQEIPADDDNFHNPWDIIRIALIMDDSGTECTNNCRTENGIVSVQNSNEMNSVGTFTYRPDPDFNGTDRFIFTGTDLAGFAAGPEEIIITIYAVNDGPSAQGFSVGIPQNTEEKPSMNNNIQLRGSDIDGDVLTYIIEAYPSNGAITNQDGSAIFSDTVNGSIVNYIPELDFTGNDEFQFSVTDTTGAQSSTVTVDIEINTSGIIYVDVNAAQSGDTNGSRWNLAFNNLQDAIDKAMPYDEIWMACGIYHAEAAAGQVALLNKTGISIYGGFEGNEDERDQRNVADMLNLEISLIDANAHTILSGYTGSTDLYVPRVLITENTANIENLIIINGNGAGAYTNIKGAGIYASGGTLSMNNVFFSGNRANAGGALFTDGIVTADIQSCRFYGNYTEDSGGAIFINSHNGDRQFSVSIYNCSFQSNVSGGSGGAISILGSLSLNNSIFTGNHANTGGGAADNQSNKSVNIASCQFMQNAAGERGGAVMNAGNNDIALCTFTGNTAEGEISAEGSGGAVYNSIGTFANIINITNSVFSNNTAPNGYGGAVCNDRISAQFTGTSFLNNSALNGGAIANRNSTGANFTDCIITGNTATRNSSYTSNETMTGDVECWNYDYSDCHCEYPVIQYVINGGGGGVYNSNYARPVFFGCRFENNSADFGAAAFDVKNSSANYINSLFVNNFTRLIITIQIPCSGYYDYWWGYYIDYPIYGQGSFYIDSSSIKLINNTYYQVSNYNDITAGNTALYIDQNVTVNIRNSIFYGTYVTYELYDTSNFKFIYPGFNNENNSLDIRYSAISSGFFNDFPQLYNNISFYPFGGYSHPRFTSGYYLQGNSPCRNTGTLDLTGFISQYYINEILSRTTDGSNPDGNDNSNIDMGYHYPMPVASP